MSLAYVTVTGQFDDGSGNPVLSGTVTFTPSATVYASGVPVAVADVPVEAVISGGELAADGGGPVQLLSTANPGLTVEGRTGFWYWTAAITIPAGAQAVTDGWSFFLPSSPSSVDLYSLAGTPAP